MKKVGILSLGCPKNLVDSEAILGEFVKKGYRIVDKIEGSDIAVINTCAFIEDAKKESIDAILDLIELKKQGRIKKIIVAGCLPERYKKVLKKEFAEVDEFFGVRKFSDYKIENRLPITPPHYAYIKISEGCDNKCRYCTISKIRGSYKSRPIASILKEVKTLYDNSGGRLAEINLISQDLTYYGMDLYGRLSLTRLLRSLPENLKWIRLLYAHPAHFSDELIKIIRDSRHICKYIDLPVQHINDKILKRMGRKTTNKRIKDLIYKLRKDIPGIAIRTSLIVGLPGEGEREFKELLEFMREIKFERLGIFTYSREEGTPAFNFKNQVSEKIKKQRFDEAMKLQQEVAKEVNARFLGKTLEVLIDEEYKHGTGSNPATVSRGTCPDRYGSCTYLARTYADAPEVDGEVFVKSAKPLKPGDFADVKIVDTMEYDLVGEAIA